MKNKPVIGDETPNYATAILSSVSFVISWSRLLLQMQGNRVKGYLRSLLQHQSQICCHQSHASFNHDPNSFSPPTLSHMSLALFPPVSGNPMSFLSSSDNVVDFASHSIT